MWTPRVRFARAASDLDAFVQGGEPTGNANFAVGDEFCMEDYRSAIQVGLESSCRLFSAFPAIHEDRRRDRVRRFMTLLFMWQDREVDLAQCGDDLMVSRYEVDVEG